MTTSKQVVNAIINGENDEKIKELINIMEDKNQIFPDNGFSPLTSSCFYGRIEIVKYLLELGADINLVDEKKRFPLMMAVQNGNIELVQFLIGSGADINLINKDGESALARAVSFNRFEIFEFLISCGVDFGICGGKALVYASINDNIKIMKKLIELDVDVNSKNLSNGWTALHWACYNNNLQMVELLLNNGANENIKNKYGKTAIESASNEEIKEFIKNYNSTKFVLK